MQQALQSARRERLMSRCHSRFLLLDTLLILSFFVAFAAAAIRRHYGVAIARILPTRYAPCHADAPRAPPCLRLPICHADV